MALSCHLEAENDLYGVPDGLRQYLEDRIASGINLRSAATDVDVPAIELHKGVSCLLPLNFATIKPLLPWPKN